MEYTTLFHLEVPGASHTNSATVIFPASIISIAMLNHQRLIHPFNTLGPLGHVSQARHRWLTETPIKGAVNASKIQTSWWRKILQWLHRIPGQIIIFHKPELRPFGDDSSYEPWFPVRTVRSWWNLPRSDAKLLLGCWVICFFFRRDWSFRSFRNCLFWRGCEMPNLVGGWALPLWKIWVHQLGWGHSQLNGKLKFMFQSTKQKCILTIGT